MSAIIKLQRPVIVGLERPDRALLPKKKILRVNKHKSVCLQVVVRPIVSFWTRKEVGLIPDIDALELKEGITRQLIFPEYLKYPKESMHARPGTILFIHSTRCCVFHLFDHITVNDPI